MTTEVLEVLRRHRHLASLSEGDLDALARGFIRVHRPAEHVVFSEGDDSDALYLILEGEVVATRLERKRPIVLQHLHPGDLFGLMGVIRQRPRSATCKTVVPSELASLSKQAVLLLFHHSAPIAYAFQKALASQLARDLRASDQRFRELIARLPG